VDLLRLAAQHPEPRVRRQVVQSLGGVAEAERLPLLLSWLDTPDPQILSTTLQILVRDRNPTVSKAILSRVESQAFETRSDYVQRALLNALVEVADDSAIPALESLLNRAGWLARKTVARMGAARTLARLGTPKALEVLGAGLRSKNRLVREACLDAGAKGSE
jgi:HEAT repeat protein